jgi:NDP-sugar pyrophosphorylase family protein
VDKIDYPIVIATIGGKGTRLYPLTLLQPKSLVSIANYPIFTRLLEVIARQGIKKFVFASRGISNTLHLKNVFRYGGSFSKRLSLSHTVKFLYQPNYSDKGSADAVRFSMDHYDIKEDIIVISGDHVTDVKIKEIVSLHREKGAIATVVLQETDPNMDISQYGVAEVDDDSRILSFVEKPGPENATSKFINTGIYMFSSKIRNVLKEMGNRARDIGGNLIPYLVKEGYPVYGLKFSGYWADVGTPDTLLRVNLDILAQRVEDIRFREEHKRSEGVWIHSTTSEMLKGMEPDVKKNTFIGGDCSIDSSSSIENSSIGDNCIIKGNTHIKDSMVMDFVNIGENVTLNGCIIGRYATLEDDCVIDSTNLVEVAGKKNQTAVIGDGVHIVKGSILGAYNRVAPISSSHEVLTSGKFIDLGYDVKASKRLYFMKTIKLSWKS